MHLTSIVAALSAGALVFVGGCNTAKLTAQNTGDASCPSVTEYPCKAQALGAPGCQANPAATDPLEARIDRDASYPSGCTVIVPQPAPDESGQCVIQGTCRCNASDASDAGAPTWTCSE